LGRSATGGKKITHTHTHTYIDTQSVGLLWTIDQLVMETSTSQHKHSRETCMAAAGFEPAVSAGEWLQTNALDRAEFIYTAVSNAHHFCRLCASVMFMFVWVSESTTVQICATLFLVHVISTYNPSCLAHLIDHDIFLLQTLHLMFYS